MESLITTQSRYQAWADLAINILLKEIDLNTNAEAGVYNTTEQEKKANDEIISYLYSNRFYNSFTEDHIARDWVNFRRSQVATDIILQSTSLFIATLETEDVILSLIDTASRSIAVATWGRECDEDLCNHTLTVEVAKDIFQNNYWYLFLYVAAHGARQKYSRDVLQR